MGIPKGKETVGFVPLGLWTAGPMTAQEHTRRLITLIFAGRNRMVMIRRELPRTRRAGWVRRPFRIELRRVLLFVGPALSSALLSSRHSPSFYAALASLLLLLGFDTRSPR